LDALVGCSPLTLVWGLQPWLCFAWHTFVQDMHQLNHHKFTATHLWLLLWPASGFLHCVADCCLQDKCSLFQLPVPWRSDGRSAISFVQCTSHTRVLQPVSAPHQRIQVRRCTTCSGCNECRQPLPLVIPEGTGGSGCSAEVATVAETLRAAVISKGSSIQPCSCWTGGWCRSI
jgi:hypothetical protein